MVSMTGKFKLSKTDNYCEYMKSIGVPIKVRSVLYFDIPVIEITKEGDEWTMKTICCSESDEVKFKLGEEFDNADDDGRPCKCVFTQEGNDKLVFVKKYVDDDETRVTIVREFSDTEMKVTLTGPGGVVATRIFQKQ